MPALPRAPMHRLIPLAGVLLAMAFACGRAADEAPADANVKVAGGATSDMVVGEAMASRGLAMAAPDVMPAPQKMPGANAAGAMLIRRGDVMIRVDSIEPAMDALRRLAGSLGGSVGNVSITAGDYEVRRATLELRIPSARFDDAMSGLSPVGQVQQSSVTAEDVGEEFTDVSARVKNAQRLESRLVELIATRTGKLEDVLAVERELARVREEIERYEGRLRFLGARVETSSISVTVSEKAPIVGATPGRSVIGEAFVQAWRNFVGLVAAAISSLGVVVPVGLVLLVLVRWWRGRKRGSMEA
ncbi:MAG: DUF4349 domain-containing protein [Gemmatimonadetes bacterium]|nr:DUF4349 domain-containing protein [Gemmatimonadota bacterium]